MKKIVATDYKGKWFSLCDENELDVMDFERKEINTDWVVGEGLQEHVENCIYYGIPAYLGKNKDLHEKIAKLEKELNT